MMKCWGGGYKEESKGNDIGDKEKQEEGITLAFCNFMPEHRLGEARGEQRGGRRCGITLVSHAY